MRRGLLLERMQAHQDEILALLSEAEPMLRDPAMRDTAGLARSRWAMMRALTAYQLFKHNEVFDPAIRGQLLGEARRAERMKQACVAAGDAFRAHTTKWSGTDVAARWNEYQPTALAMMSKIRDHNATERREIADLLTSRPVVGVVGAAG